MTIFTQTRVRAGTLEEYQSPTGDVLGATAEESILFSPLSSIMRQRELARAERGAEPNILDFPVFGQPRPSTASPMMDAETARQKIAEEGLDLTVPDTGIRQRALEILIERKKDERRRQDVFARSPGGIGLGAAQLGTALGASLLDPLNVASAFIPVVGPTRYAAMVGRAGGSLARAGVRARVGALEGAVGAAVVEPLVAGVARHEQADYDLTDSLLNIGLGTALGGGLHVGVGAAGEALARGRGWWSARATEDLPRALDAAGFQTREAALRTGLAQALDGRYVDVEPIVLSAANVNARLDDVLSVAPTGRRFVLSDDVAPVSVQMETRGTGVRFHGSTSAALALDDFHSSSMNYYGNGFYTTDALDVSKGYAGRRRGQQGAVYAVEARPVETFDMEQSIPGWLVADNDDDLVRLALSENPKNVREMYDGIRDLSAAEGVSADEVQGVFDTLRDRMEGRGYRAMRHLGGLRTNSAPHDVVIYFTPSEDVSIRPTSPDEFTRYAPSSLAAESRGVNVTDLRSRVQASFQPEASRLADFQAVRIADEQLKAAPADDAMPEVSLNEVMENISALASALDAARAPKRAAFKPGLPADPEKKMPARPVLGMLRDAGGVRPGSTLAAELNAMGVTAKTVPGLFRKNGRGAADNFVRSEHPLFSQVGGDDDLGGYIREDEILDAIRDELFGAPRRTPEQTAEIERYRAVLDAQAGVVREEVEGLAEYLDQIPRALDEADYGTYEAMVARELAEFEELRSTAEVYGRAVAAAANCQLRRGA